MPRRHLALLLIVPGLVLLGLTLVFAAPRNSKSRQQDFENVQLLVDVLAEVDAKYVQELTPEQRRKLVEDMINGGLDRLDPYSSFYNSEDYRQFNKQTEGAFGGVGIQIGVDRTTGLLQVTSPMVGTPAYEAGILAGDLVLKVDGKPLDNLRYNDILKLIQGEPGTPVTLTVIHEGTKDPIDITMNRAKIEFPAIMADLRKPDNPKEWDFFVDKTNRIAYLRLIAFNEHASGDLRKVLQQLKAEGARGLVIDLRDNPGGLLTAAVEISNMFLVEGPIVSIRDRKGRGKTYEAKANGTVFETVAACPLAILVNKNSASASEIVAAALQDHQRAVIVGERSFGKGSVQNVIELPERDPPVALKLTTASYWRPSGQNIHRNSDSKDTDEWGVKPNAGYEVKLTDTERLQFLVQRRQRDVVQGKPGVAKPKEEKPMDDKVLDKALEYIRSELKKR